MTDEGNAGLMPDAAALAAVEAEIAGYNALRPQVARDAIWRMVLYMGGWALVSALISWPLVTGGHSNVFGFVFVGIVFSGYYVYDQAISQRKGFQQALRDRMLPVIFGFVKDLHYSNGRTPRFMNRMPGEELVRRTRSTHGDTITGVYDGLAFTLSETELAVGSGKHKEVTFKGVIVYFQQEKPFTSELLAAKRPGRFSQAMRGLFGDRSKLMEVKSGDVFIDASHEFRTDNPTEAASRVAAMAKALGYLSEVWRDGVMRIAIQRGDGFLLVPSTKDFFELPPIDVPLDFDAHAKPMIRDFVTLLATARLVSRI